MLMKMIVSYDGTNFAGFQQQPGRRTVQGVLQEVLQDLLGPGLVMGASRTDAGVHARGQVITWQGRVPIPLERLATVINRRLPSDVQVGQCEWVPNEFHPIRSAHAKYYSYTIARGSAPLWPGLTRYAYPVAQPLSWSHLNEAARLLLGHHDFWAFRSEGSSARTTIRHIFLSRWSMLDHGTIWRYDVGANGFLYHMVRILVAAMLYAAEVQDVGPLREALVHPRARKWGGLVPAQGLVLERIVYNGKDRAHV
ncbi:MAG: tRNA pseudouridine(38-40) synthase TruA [Sulfobacillus thermosulfidooxidans]|uniref:tRNA pseudouridine(38-40) synthase TruA n=1 Tax=Sulfobacillus TaxID=28033 RepID=UPI000CD05FEF|nr:tRNA pseudouridine(38-40) synthase TruA [Sulfobacillus sp. hq2]POB11167.1 tRNA pseudouridine(38-40) synthase TruA [Sulfobacillus sp. hq2]PSR32798.1 MAG: tRNA pseudouridine(38-40) synthase TruA [Sulfobacillus thermosulfidooxidans]